MVDAGFQTVVWQKSRAVARRRSRQAGGWSAGVGKFNKGG